MKKYLGLVVLLVAAGLVFSGCESCKKAKDASKEEVVVEETETVVVEGVSPKAAKISKDLSETLCKRMVECAPGTLTEEECVNQTTLSLNEAQKVKPIDVADDKMAECLASIKSGTCEQVLGTEPPKGCDFLN